MNYKINLIIDVEGGACCFDLSDLEICVMQALKADDCHIEVNRHFQHHASLRTVDGLTGFVDSEGFGARLNEKRKERGLTSEKLAEMIGGHESTVSRHIHESRVPRTHTIYRYAEALQVSAAWLAFGGAEE